MFGPYGKGYLVNKNNSQILNIKVPPLNPETIPNRFCSTQRSAREDRFGHLTFYSSQSIME